MQMNEAALHFNGLECNAAFFRAGVQVFTNKHEKQQFVTMIWGISFIFHLNFILSS